MVIFFLLIRLLLPLPTAQAHQPWPLCGTSEYYTANSAYQANLRLLSSTLPARTSSNATLFATGTAGDSPDTVYALALCRGDTNASACGICVSTAFQDAVQVCPYHKDATLYYGTCIVRFSNTNFLATTTTTNVTDLLILYNSLNFTTNVTLSLFTLINETAQSAASSLRRFATSRLDVNSAPKLYCLMQCKPDLSARECAACFRHFTSLALEYLDGHRGGQILGVQCSMRYEEYPFYQGEPTLRIVNLIDAVPTTNNTTQPPITVYPNPQSPAASPAEAQTV